VYFFFEKFCFLVYSLLSFRFQCDPARENDPKPLPPFSPNLSLLLEVPLHSLGC